MFIKIRIFYIVFYIKLIAKNRKSNLLRNLITIYISKLEISNLIISKYISDYYLSILLLKSWLAYLKKLYKIFLYYYTFFNILFNFK